MLEPTLACNIACIGCGKIREYESNKARLTVDECIDSAVQCPAPVVSVCGGEPLIFKGIEDVVAGFLEMKKTVELCTNALRLVEYLNVFKPDPRLTFVVHLDGMREIHDYICDYPGLWDIAVDAIKQARKAGFRVSTNTTIFKETSVEDVVEMMGYMTNEVGIDGLLIAPGYQYSQIDPALTMTRDEHREKFRRIRAAAKEHGYRWLASPLSTRTSSPGERELPARRGFITRNPYGWKGPVLPAHGRDLPSSYEALMGGQSSGRCTGRGTTPRCEHCAIHCGFEPLPPPPLRPRASRQTVRSMALELSRDDAGLRHPAPRSGPPRKLGARTALVGVGAAPIATRGPVSRVLRAPRRRPPRRARVRRGAPTRQRVVDPDGAVLWEGGPLGVTGARPASPPSPWMLHRRRSRRAPPSARAHGRRCGRHGVRRAGPGRAAWPAACGAISDTPERTLGPLGAMPRRRGAAAVPSRPRPAPWPPPRRHGPGTGPTSARALTRLEKVTV